MIVPQIYTYDLVNGKNKTVGQISISCRAMGKSVLIPRYSILKEPYNCKKPYIELPIGFTQVYDDGVEYRIKRFLSVKGLKKREVDFLKTVK